ncbi:hypothetical protein [Patiriisocius marinistellae]|nr:hypothetical protein [Patiriisocius marinistellae]
MQKVFFKRQILDDIIFDITDLQDEVTKQKFDTVINKYILWLNAFCYYSEAMLNDIYSLFPNIVENEYLAFKYQYFNFLEHRESILEICNIQNSKPYSLDDIVSLSNLTAIDSKPDEFYDFSNEKLYVPKVYSMPNIGFQNVEQFLLESVFNIKSK